MTQSGGPAAINGFLYQIIHHLGWLADVTFSGKLDGETIEDACLVLEPRSGGDARAEASGVYLVEQYKTRKNGTWALSDIQSVLGDLRKAVQPSRPMMARYRFVIDGRAGRLDTFRAFLTDLESAQGPCDLDNIERKSFGSDFVGTDREFFDHIVIATRSGASPPNVGEPAVVFHLLSCFEMEFGVDASARADTLEGLLRRYAPDLGDERKIREHLVGVLVETLSKGETRLDAAGIDALFRRVGLNPQRLRNLAVLAETMSALTRRRLVRLKYQRGRDIRVVPTWPADKPVLLIAGESGAGKTDLVEDIGLPNAAARKDIIADAISVLSEKWTKVSHLNADVPAFVKASDGLDGRRLRKAMITAAASSIETARDLNRLQAEHVLQSLKQAVELEKSQEKFG